MTHPDDELVEKVARALDDAFMDPAIKVWDWRAEARAAIAVCMEEAAKVAETFGAYQGHGEDSIAFKIRSLSPKVR